MVLLFYVAVAMIEVDVAVVGSGVAALKALCVAREANRSAIAVDAPYSDGGYLQLLDDLGVPKAPFFVYPAEAGFFERLGVSMECLDVAVRTVKTGDYGSKTAGFAGFDVQRNWFLEWVEQRRLCTARNAFGDLKKALGLPADRPIHIASSIRRIDVARRVLALSSGEIVRFGLLVYTWPLPLLPRYVSPEEARQRIATEIEGLVLDHASAYIIAAPTTAPGNTIEIYTHGTKASRMHTAIKLAVGGTPMLYTVTSYSKKYPLLPGIHEKLLSELRRHKIANPQTLKKRHSINIAYALLNNTDQNKIKNLEQILQNHNIAIYGRLGQWKDRTVKEILEDEKLYQTIK